MNAVFEEEEEQLPAGMTDDELASICMEEVSRGIGGSVRGETGDQDITRPLNYYFGREPGLSTVRAKDKNASSFVSMDVMDGVEATVAEIMPTFMQNEIAFYEPVDEQDEDQSRTESALVNYLFLEEYDGFTLLQCALKDTFLHRNCTAKVFWDERACVEYEVHEDVPEMALGQLLQPNAENQEVEVVEQYISEEGDPTLAMEIEQVAAVRPDIAAGVAQTPQGQQEMQQAQLAAQDKYTIKIKRTTVKGKPCIESIPPEQVIVNGDHDSPFLHKARFVAHEKIETQSSLIEQGFDPAIVEELGDYSGEIQDDARSRKEEENNYDSSHRSTRRILVYECYPLVDFDGDGIAERRKVVISNNRLLSNDEWTDVPLVGGVAYLVPHKYKGTSLFDRLKEIQDAKTPLTRAIIDGTQLAANPRVGIVTGEVNLDDLLSSRTGGAVRMDSLNSIGELPNPQVPQTSYTMLDYMDKLRSERGGSAVGTAAQAREISGDSAHGLERTMSAMELNNAVVARSIGETLVRGIFIQLHKLLREHYQGPLSARIGGEWMTTVPKNWRKRSNVSVQIGSSHAERQRHAMVLNQVIQHHMALRQSGSMLVDEEKHYAAVTDLISLSGLKAPEKYYISPSSPQGEQAKQARTQQQQEAMQQQEQAQQLMMQAQAALARAEVMKATAANDKVQLEAQLKSMQQELDAYESGAKTALETQKVLGDQAIRITELEQQHQRELSADVRSNRP